VPPILVAGSVWGLLLLAFGHWQGILPLAIYLLGVAFVAVTAAGLSLKSRIALIVALATMHFSWGWGFVIGFLRGATGTIDRSRVRKG
jgi:uncharacterized membrane protein